MADLFSITAVATITATFLLAGTVKGIIGLGLPTVSLGLLVLVFDLTTAMALLLAPSFATNLWQATTGGHGRVIVRRLWPFLLLATSTVWLGALALTRVDLSLLSALLGGLLVTYATLNLVGIRLTTSASQEAWLGPLFGTANGILTGMTGSFVVPGVLFLQSIGLSRNQLVQAMGVLFMLSTVALALALQGKGILSAQLSLASAAAVVPAAVGMAMGQRLRQTLSEERFRRVFFVALLLLGAYVLGKAPLGMR